MKTKRKGPSVTVQLTEREAEAMSYAFEDAYYGHTQRVEGSTADPEDIRAWKATWRACERVEAKILRAWNAHTRKEKTK